LPKARKAADRRGGGTESGSTPSFRALRVLSFVHYPRAHARQQRGITNGSPEGRTGTKEKGESGGHDRRA
jgi:hypothetical protein